MPGQAERAKSARIREWRAGLLKKLNKICKCDSERQRRVR
jgi:hypothetical protein